MKNVYGDAVMDISNVRRWVKKFRNWETEIVDKQRSGQSTTPVTHANCELTDELIPELHVRKLIKLRKRQERSDH